MVVADVTRDVYIDKKDRVMTRPQQSTMVVVLDETCHDRQFSKPTLQNGVEAQSRRHDKVDGILSKDDIDMLLTMFDTGSDILLSRD
jgi:hypothetical protein